MAPISWAPEFLWKRAVLSHAEALEVGAPCEVVLAAETGEGRIPEEAVEETSVEDVVADLEVGEVVEVALVDVDGARQEEGLKIEEEVAVTHPKIEDLILTEDQLLVIMKIGEVMEMDQEELLVDMKIGGVAHLLEDLAVVTFTAEEIPDPNPWVAVEAAEAVATTDMEEAAVPMVTVQGVVMEEQALVMLVLAMGVVPVLAMAAAQAMVVVLAVADMAEVQVVAAMAVVLPVVDTGAAMVLVAAMVTEVVVMEAVPAAGMAAAQEDTMMDMGVEWIPVEVVVDMNLHTHLFNPKEATEAAAVVAQVAEAPEDVTKLSARFPKDELNQPFCIFSDKNIDLRCVFNGISSCQFFLFIVALISAHRSHTLANSELTCDNIF